MSGLDSPPPPLPSGETLLERLRLAEVTFLADGFESLAGACRDAASTLSALRAERDTLAGQVAQLEAAQQQFIERIADWSQHAPDAAKRYQEIVQEARRQRTIAVARAALAGADGADAPELAQP